MKNKTDSWEGYTMQELQMHRAINAIRLEVEKEKLLSKFEGFKEGAAGNVTSFLLRNLGTVSKGVALSSAIVGITRRLFSIFRRK